MLEKQASAPQNPRKAQKLEAAAATEKGVKHGITVSLGGPKLKGRLVLPTERPARRVTEQTMAPQAQVVRRCLTERGGKAPGSSPSQFFVPRGQRVHLEPGGMM